MRHAGVGLLLAIALCIPPGCESDTSADESPKPAEKTPRSSESTTEGSTEARSSDESEPAQNLEEAVAEKTPFEAARLEPYARAWQGHWLVDEFGHAGTVAMRVSGGEMTYAADKEAEPQSGKFRVIAPCLAKTVVDNPSEGVQESTVWIAFVHGEKGSYAMTPEARAGVVTDDGFVACVKYDVIFEKDDSGCRVWQTRFDDWKQQEVECSLTEEHAELPTPSGGTMTLDRRGDLLLGDGIKDRKLRSFPDFDAALSNLE